MPKQLQQVTDHKGNTYRCCQDMCAAYNIIPNTYRRRIKEMGMTQEQALTIPVVKGVNQYTFGKTKTRKKK